MRVLGLDPGLLHCGWAVFDVYPGSTVSYIAGGVFEQKNNSKPMDRAGRLARLVFEVAIGHRCGVVVYESPSMPPNAGSSWKIGLAFGVIAALGRGRKLVSVSPLAMRKAVLGEKWKPRVKRSGKDARNAIRGVQDKEKDKGVMIETIRRRFRHVLWPKRTTLHEHLADAIGVVFAALTLGELEVPCDPGVTNVTG